MIIRMRSIYPPWPGGRLTAPAGGVTLLLYVSRILAGLKAEDNDQTVGGRRAILPGCEGMSRCRGSGRGCVGHREGKRDLTRRNLGAEPVFLVNNSRRKP